MNWFFKNATRGQTAFAHLRRVVLRCGLTEFYRRPYKASTQRICPYEVIVAGLAFRDSSGIGASGDWNRPFTLFLKRMIIWINGAFGVGKSHTAAELVRRIHKGFLFDPEQVGFFLRRQLPNADQYEDFQDHPLWRRQVVENLAYCDGQNVVTVVPMTLVEDAIFDFIVGGLRARGVEVRHFALIAEKKTIDKRLIRRGEKKAWTFKQVDRCVASLTKPKYALQIDAEKNNLDQVVEQIAGHCGLVLQKNRLTWLTGKLNWLRVTIKNKR